MAVTVSLLDPAAINVYFLDLTLSGSPEHAYIGQISDEML